MNIKKFIQNKYSISNNQMDLDYFDKFSGDELVELIKEYLNIEIKSKNEDSILIYTNWDSGKWAISGYGIVSDDFRNPHQALEFILTKR